MKFSKIFTLTSALFFPLPLLASQIPGSWTEVTAIYSPSNGNDIFVEFASGSMPGCYNSNGGYLYSSTLDGNNKAYSIILAGLMSKRPILPYFEIVGDNINSWSRCRVTAVYIK